MCVTNSHQEGDKHPTWRGQIRKWGVTNSMERGGGSVTKTKRGGGDVTKTKEGRDKFPCAWGRKEEGEGRAATKSQHTQHGGRGKDEGRKKKGVQRKGRRGGRGGKGGTRGEGLIHFCRKEGGGKWQLGEGGRFFVGKKWRKGGNVLGVGKIFASLHGKL